MNELIIDWIDFCENRKSFDKSHFYTLFWEDITKEDLLIIFQYFPNSDQLYKLTKNYLFDTTNEKVVVTENLLIEFAVKDFEQKKKLILNNTIIIKLLNNLKIEFIKDYELVEKSLLHEPYSVFYDSISDYVFDHWILYDKKTYALEEAFYGLVKDYQIVWYLFSPLIKVDIDFENYLKLFCLGGKYSIIDDKLVVSQQNR